MQVEITSELATAHRKTILAQQKIDQLFKAGKNRRDEEVRYWTEQIAAWVGYTNQLNQLAHYGHIEITKTIMRSGEFHITATTNGRHIKNIGKANIPQEILDNLAIGANYLSDEPCARCGAFGTEEHHWAPKELFEDAEQWPKDYLCKTCHEHWHKVVTIPFRTLRRKELTDVKPAA